MEIKINFTDFWPGFIREDNYFYNLLSKEYTVVISDDPELIFFSCYGEEYLKYDCIRIFYSAENMRPDLTGCDFAMTFDYMDDARHYRLPLYALYIEQKKKMHDLLTVKSEEQSLASWNSKTKFCCMVVSNGLAKKRIDFFHALSKYKKVDSGGRYLNNVGGPVDDKMSFIRDYKFVIAFENSSSPGYTTEKILEPMLAGSIPVYWGNPLIGEDFNDKSFLNYDDLGSGEQLIESMLAMESDSTKAVAMLSQPKFPNNELPPCIREENVLAFLKKIIAGRKDVQPVARTFRRVQHLINRKKNILYHHLQVIRRKNFR